MMGEQTIEGDDGRSFRVVVIDPTLNRVEAEDAAGVLLIDTIGRDPQRRRHARPRRANRGHPRP